ncbi:hypothetical protein COEREDRAFT_10572 [Coemansia reversa NRRL 1564]|uniref:Trafficking protein particle complex subunit 11 domain-containing protein n=1 Tax=Coemansia reversa (strain ATCC 12441 / NRRL 1564) TaxID=763665 RepID=A0A2G5B592_COERN|nr:hypothetical protein COEREDRAFT_10572 [Coemansia reversa NRRL 1564]|eukprot:PIA14213.1 hypothetical protein COEREDRAFT_10572 [Coemansia reversa NRRL 1564]
MAELAFGESAEKRLCTPYTQHYYPVLGVLNSPDSKKSSDSGRSSTAQAQKISRTLLQYFRGGSDDEAEHVAAWWDPVGPRRGPRWQTVAYPRVDDIPRRKARTQQTDDGADELSPRGMGILRGEGLLTERWVTKQQRRPATVVSLHALTDESGDAQTAEDMARNRVCLAAFGLTYTAVVVGGAEDATEARVAALAQRAGLDGTQMAVCRADVGPALQAFAAELERQLFRRAAAYYTDAFMRTQRRVAELPQLPLPPRADDAGATYQALRDNDHAVVALEEPALVAQYSRFLPLRAWLVRYHFKLALFAECAGDRDTAQRCQWLAYAHLAAYIGEIASGAYLPAGHDAVADGPPIGWMWALNGGDGDGQRAHSLRMFGARWDEAVVLLEAVHLRIVRGWLYQSLELAALRATQQAATTGTWSYAFGGGGPQQRYTVAAVHRSAPRPVAAVNPGVAGSGSASPVGGASGAAAADGNGSLEPLVLSVHAGEVNAATERMMDAERRRRDAHTHTHPAYYVALGSESSDVDLLQSPASAWWPLGGFHAVVDFARQPREVARLGLVINSSRDTSCAAAQLPADNQYDQCLTLAARQCAEHVLLLARVLERSGFGHSCSYFWACVARQFEAHAALHVLVARQGMGFARALSVAMLRLSDSVQGPGTAGRHLIATLLGALRLSPSAGPAVQQAGFAQTTMSEDDVSNLTEPSVPSSAFAGFAFEQAFDDGADNNSTSSRSGMDFHSQRVSERTPVAGGCLLPQWMWPESPALLFHFAAVANLRRSQRLAAEDRIYATDGDHGLQREFNANPGVENSYVALWLMVERARAEETRCNTAKLLAAALATLPGAGQSAASRAAQEIAAQSDDLSSLDILISDKRPGTHATRLCLYLTSVLAEIYAECGKHQKALDIFGQLVKRFRHEGWPLLTAHTLQWTTVCAVAVHDTPASVRALIELLSPRLLQDMDQRYLIARRLLRAGSELSSAQDVAAVCVDMTQIYSPILCHAHWRHWELGSTMSMPFQLTFDCRGMPCALVLHELLVEFDDSRYNVHVSAGSLSDVVVADTGQTVCYYEINTAGDGQASLELRPDSVAVFEGSVFVSDDHGSHALHTSGTLSLTAVSATVALDGTGGTEEGRIRLQLRWPTSAKTRGTSDSINEAGGYAASSADSPLNPIELLLLGNMAISRMQGSELGLSGQLSLPPALLGQSRHSMFTLQDAISVAGPAASLPLNRKWLHVSTGAKRVAQWLELPTAPLLPTSILSGGLESMQGSGPAYSAYSRCRILCLPKPSPAVLLTIPSVAALAPAYCGESFPVEIRVENMHTRPISRIELDIRLEAVELANGSDSMSDLNMGDVPSARASVLSLPKAAPVAAEGLVGKQTSDSENAAVSTPWLQQGQNGERLQEICGLEMLTDDALQPQQTCTSTVKVHFPGSDLLHSAWKSAASSSVAVVRCTARWSVPNLAAEEGTSSAGEWTGQTSVKVSIPVVRPLYANITPLLSHVTAPVKPLSTGEGARQLSSIIPANELFGGEYCFRRPVLVNLCNAGPWDVVIGRVVLRPPLTGDELPLRVQLAGTTAMAEQSVIAAGSAQQLEFCLDIYTSDVVRMPSEICPGTLEIEWRRSGGVSSNVLILTRLWMPPLELIAKCVQVESECSPIVRVGEPLAVCYRLLNPTRATQAIEATMRAADGFVFAGPRRTSLNIMPGHVALLRFNMLPLSSMPQHQLSVSDGVQRHVPGHLVLGLGRHAIDSDAVSAADGRESMSSERRQQKQLLFPHSSVRQGGDVGSARSSVIDSANLPPSNIAGHGWVQLPRLDLRLVERRPRRASGSIHSPLSQPATGLRSLLGAATSAVAAPPPTREVSSLVLEPSVAGRPSKTQLVQRTIVKLAGLELPPEAESAAGILTPALMEDCVDMLPDYLLHGRCEASGADSELEDSETEDSGSLHSSAASKSIVVNDTISSTLLRFDQTSIFCLPENS